MNKITPRQTYIMMLRHRVGAIDGLSDEQKQHFLWAELIAAGYLNGENQRCSRPPKAVRRLRVQRPKYLAANQRYQAAIRICLADSPAQRTAISRRIGPLFDHAGNSPLHPVFRERARLDTITEMRGFGSGGTFRRTGTGGILFI